MKKLILTSVILIIGFVAFAGNNTKDKGEDNTHIISGKVVDKISGEEIVGAEINLGDKIIFTDLDGNFTTNINNSKPELVVKFISYHDTKITIDSFSYKPIVIELASK
jgi:CarboxypepD_reg-like domain